MQMRHIEVAHFGGIEYLDWNPGVPFCGLVGPGDAGKSTVLDAGDVARASRWLAFTEPSFLAGFVPGFEPERTETPATGYTTGAAAHIASTA